MGSNAVFAVVPRLVARVSGEQPLAFLDATTSQDLSRLAPGRGALTCLLDDKGRIQAELRALPLEDGAVLIDGEPDCASGIEYLARVAPLSGCEVADESGSWTFIAVRDARAEEAFAFELPSDEHAFATWGSSLVVRVEWGSTGYDVLTPERIAIDAREISTSDFDALRIASGRPAFGVDFDETTHIAETPLIERAVSFIKGCYPGQESVARVQNLGRARRRLVGLEIETDAVPARGTPLVDGDAEVGEITSAASWDGRTVAIAVARAEIGTTVTVDGARAAVRAL